MLRYVYLYMIFLIGNNLTLFRFYSNFYFIHVLTFQTLFIFALLFSILYYYIFVVRLDWLLCSIYILWFQTPSRKIVLFTFFFHPLPAPLWIYFNLFNTYKYIHFSFKFSKPWVCSANFTWFLKRFWGKLCFWIISFYT